MPGMPERGLHRTAPAQPDRLRGVHRSPARGTGQRAMAGPGRDSPPPPDRRDLPGIYPSPARRRPPRQPQPHRRAARPPPGGPYMTISTTRPIATPASDGQPEAAPAGALDDAALLLPAAKPARHQLARP